jgi:hypothetical protein
MLDANERKALTLSAFAGACLCFAPAEFISGGLLLLLSGLLYLWDLRMLRREAAAAPAPVAALGPTPDG